MPNKRYQSPLISPKRTNKVPIKTRKNWHTKICQDIEIVGNCREKSNFFNNRLVSPWKSLIKKDVYSK